MVRPSAEEPESGAGAEGRGDQGQGGGGLELRPPGLRKMGGAYQAALEAVFAIPIAVVFGYFVDKHFGTSPIFLLVGVVMGFAAFVLRLVRLGRTIPPTQGDASEDRPEQ
jgi:F0F1-type ATP synthase assembly protein I